MSDLYFSKTENVGANFQYKKWEAGVLYENVLVARMHEKTSNGRVYDSDLGDIAVNVSAVPITKTKLGHFWPMETIGFAFGFEVYGDELRCSLFFFEDYSGFASICVTAEGIENDGTVKLKSLTGIYVHSSCAFSISNEELRKALNDVISTAHELECQKEELEKKYNKVCIEYPHIESCSDSDHDTVKGD